MAELYKKYRPKVLQKVVGQAGALASIQKLLDKGELPHALLLSGPSGCGKTTVARILKKSLDCGNADWHEINSSDHRGVEMVREIRRYMNLAPIEGECRIWLIDECHKLTSDAQNAFLKMLEDTPAHVYFFLVTTDAGKLIKAIHTRCTEVRFVSLTEDQLEGLLLEVIKYEAFEVEEKIVKEIVGAAEGSARKALVILGQVGGLKGEEAQLAAVQASSVNKDQAIALARALVNHNAGWKEVAVILKDLKDEDPEGIRYLVLAYSRAILLSGGPLAPRAFMIIDYFSENFWDSKQAGLAAACWAVVNKR
jgi:DNA polymerase-3 subunit gamma/tau